MPLEMIKLVEICFSEQNEVIPTHKLPGSLVCTAIMKRKSMYPKTIELWKICSISSWKPFSTKYSFLLISVNMLFSLNYIIQYNMAYLEF